MGQDRRRGRLGLLPLLTATLTTTMANTVVNVPMSAILADLHAPLGRGVFVSTAFTVTLAALMPLSGWLGDRLGRRRVLCAAMLLMAIGSAGAAFARSLPELVAFRLLQGLSAAPVLPVVMVLVVEVLGADRRGRALGLWAAANGAGQALGPTAGGLLAGWFGWRAVFWPIVPLSVLVVAGGLLLLPPDRTRAGKEVLAPLDWRGATLLTVGAALLLGATASVPAAGPGSPTVWAVVAAGALVLAAFVRVERGRPEAFLPPHHLLEVRYVRSAFAVAAQMFTLGATLLAAPAYLVLARGASSVEAGLAVLALPLAMSALAPVAGFGAERLGGRLVMRAGLVTLLAGLALLAMVVGLGGDALPLAAALMVLGAGVAFVQTPAATGASRSRAGRTGAGLGLFNLIRFGGTALGAACVALLGSRPHELVAVFVVCAVFVAAGLALAFVGGDPSDSMGGRPGRQRTPKNQADQTGGESSASSARNESLRVWMR
ncbi:MFS transporter [Streptomyces sp. NPDC000880]